MKETWLGAQGVSCWLLVCLKGPGAICTPPQVLAADSGLPATAEARTASNFRRSVSASGALAMVGGGSENIKKKKRKDATCNYLLLRSSGLLPTVPP